MSYAEQYFGSKQSQVLNCADNLAWFGKDSYAYRNTNLMLDIIKNKIAMSNPIIALYAYIWARENGYNAIDLFKIGLKISVYNSDIDKTYEFVLSSFNDDGSATFITTESAFMFTSSTATVGTEVLSLENYDIVQYLNGEASWYEKWSNKPASVISSNVLPYLQKKLRSLNGFLYGLDETVKDILMPFSDDNTDLKVLPLEYEDVANNEYILDNYITLGKFNKISKNAYYFNEDNLGGYITSETSYKINGTYWHILIGDVENVEDISEDPLKRGVIQTVSPYVFKYYRDTVGVTGCPKINSMALMHLKIKM